ncbi:NAD/NADP octopine/nopaline dehydrogenase, alpha-helical domain protein [Pseudoramibacter alactolyticus ATCC 23263]|uniref:NAD/NADP octopine/nopaline dehydrogenase, alpha-helical domain protein n=1 Tax=Pseudoramibacter alactolyticus ATCC 23263 TaxID=887929 RepID=E6MIU6_9FIRM|nr:NAD/NADP octopine/nopaline dehydrogenase family protein [Pseudoramibacter alactolyticus]EFV00971.1 NAD/NADP octopine/nopaline dehydrogenase, alpha-helical domain protein [Pseudoramibacter alactolyticus ATCC 23263]
MDMRYLKDKPIAIIGAGGVGKTMAGDCALAGQKVNLWEQEGFKKNLTNIMRTGIKLSGNQFSTYGFERKGIGRLNMATTDMAEAVKGAGNIIVTTIAGAHETVFRELIPLLEDGQVVHIIPDNLGTFEFRKIMRELGCTTKVIVGAWYTAPYGVRIVRRGGVTTNECKVEDRITFIRGAALPASDSDDFIAAADYIGAFDAIRTGDGFIKGTDVIDVNLGNVNPVIHVPGTVLGVSTMQNFDTVLGQEMKNYSLYGFALCPAIAQVQSVFWEEEKALAKAMNVGLTTVNYEDFFSRTTMYGKEYMGPDFAVPFEEKYENFFGDGPFSLEDRYITEDVPVGCYFIQQLGDKYDVPTPIVDSMILLASTMLDRDLTGNSKFTLDYLEIGHMNDAQLKDYILNGNFTAK